MSYQVEHKLTNKPVRNTYTLKVITFRTLGEAEEFCKMKNRIMGADFYKVTKTNEEK